MTELNPNQKRRPKNVAEGKLFDLMTGAGWEVTKRGWPDFFCIRDGQVCVVECKPYENSALKATQRIVMRALAAHGIPCFRYDPSSGMNRLLVEDLEPVAPPPSPEIPETLEGKLKFILGRMPGLTEKVKDLDKTVATLVTVYLDDFSEEWMIEQAKSERRWVFARQGKPVLTTKKDGNKTILNWFRMRADDARKERPKLAGQERGRKAKPETGLDDCLTEERA